MEETPAVDSEFDESQPTEMPPITNEMAAVIRRSQASRVSRMSMPEKLSSERATT